MPVILSFKYNKQKVKIKSGIFVCICLFSPVGTYALEGIQFLLIMPKSYRKSEAIAAPNQGKDMAFLYEDQTVDSSPLIATITIAIWT